MEPLFRARELNALLNLQFYKFLIYCLPHF